MQAYDQQEAYTFILEHIRQDGRLENMEPAEIEQGIKKAMELEAAYLDTVGDGYYDEDDAFEAIADGLAEDEEKELDAAELADAFLEYLMDFLEDKGLIQWDE